MKISKHRIRELINESLDKFVDSHNKYGSYGSSDHVETIVQNKEAFNRLIGEFIEMFLSEYIPYSIVMIDNFDPEDHSFDFSDSYGNYYDFNPFAGIGIKLICSILYRIVSNNLSMHIDAGSLEKLFHEITSSINSDTYMSGSDSGSIASLNLNDHSFEFVQVGEEDYGLHGTTRLFNVIEDYMFSSDFDPNKVLYHNSK